jgi:hypothetical protein
MLKSKPKKISILCTFKLGIGFSLGFYIYTFCITKYLLSNLWLVKMDQLGQRKKFHFVHIFIHPSPAPPPPSPNNPTPSGKDYQQNALVNHNHLLFALLLLTLLVRNLSYIHYTAFKK